MPMLDRRSFLGRAAAVPLLFSARGLGRWLPRGDDRVLLVLELQGGNDGLNTVIPADDPRYGALRPKLQAARKGVHRLADGTALHAALARLHARIAAQRGAVLHGVGYAKPDRSHFRSRDIWHVADPSHTKVSASTTGWLGRAADLLAGRGAGMPAAAVGGLEVPLLLKATRVTVPSLERIEDFQWLSATGKGPLDPAAPTRAVSAGQREAPLLDFVQATARTGQQLAAELTAAIARYAPRAEYPQTPLGRDLQLAARLCIAGFGTRLLHVGMPGFDTHARQLPTHTSLLGQLDAALDAFLGDLEGHGCADKVAVLVHSEFGRRAAENASQGTDHGAAGPAFTFGGGLRGGPLGPVPDLVHLDDGDLVATRDFRCVYADLLRWLGVDEAKVLGARFESAGLWPAG